MEVKLRETVREESERADAGDNTVVVIEFCAGSGHMHLGSCLHLTLDIEPECTASEACKALKGPDT